MMEVVTVLAIVVVLGLFANKYMKERDQALINERAAKKNWKKRAI